MAEDIPAGHLPGEQVVPDQVAQAAPELGEAAMTAGGQVAGAAEADGAAVALVEGAHHDVHPDGSGQLDHDTALERAYAEKGDRESGMEVAEMAGRVESFEPDQGAGRADQARAFHAHMADSPLYNRLADNPGERGEVSQVAGTGIRNKMALETDVVGWGGADKARLVQGMNSAAALYERRAQRKGDWAQAIHEHPPSDEFLAANDWDPSEVTPERLMRVEDVRGRLLGEADGWDDRLNQLEARYATLRTRGENVNMAGMLAASMGEDSEALVDPDAYAIFQDLSAKNETTIGDLKQVYGAMCQAEAGAIRHAVGKSDRLIAAIRSGDFGQPPEQPAEAA